MHNTQFPFKITHEPAFLGERDKVFLDEYSKIYRYVDNRNTPSLKKAERFFLRWKEYPEVWNLYYIALGKNKYHKHAEELLESMVGLFPNYICGLCNYGLLLIRQAKIDKAEDYFGQTPALEQAFPGRDTFCYKEVLLYYSVFIELEIAKNKVLSQ